MLDALGIIKAWLTSDSIFQKFDCAYLAAEIDWVSIFDRIIFNCDKLNNFIHNLGEYLRIYTPYLAFGNVFQKQKEIAEETLTL